MASRRPNPQADRPAPRLTLVTPVIGEADEFARVLSELLTLADIAAVLLRLAPADDRTLIERVAVMSQVVQPRDAALLLDGHAELVERAGADGAHLSGVAALQGAIGRLHPAHVAGAGALHTRHDAMLAAEAGADYVMFGEPDASGHRPALSAIVERVAWWAEIFQPSCVGYAGELDEIAPLTVAGADFIALGDWIWSAAEGPAAAITRAAKLIAQAEAVA